MARMHKHIDLDELNDLTECGWATEQLAERYGVRRQYVHWLRTKYNLTRPPRQPPFDAPSVAEDEASSDSLALSPWVQARIKELRLGLPQEVTT